MTKQHKFFSKQHIFKIAKIPRIRYQTIRFFIRPLEIGKQSANLSLLSKQTTETTVFKQNESKSFSEMLSDIMKHFEKYL